MWSMLWFGQYSWKVNKETSRGQKSCWCSCLEVSNSDGKKLSALVLFQHHQYAERMVMVILVMGRNGGLANIWDGVRVIQDNEECVIWLLMLEDTYEWLVPYPELMKLLSTAWGGPGLNWIWTQIILWLNCPSSCSDHQSQWIKLWITMGLNNFR